MKMNWDDKWLKTEAQAAAVHSTKAAALVALNNMERRVPFDEGDLYEAMFMRKSKFKNGGYVVGVSDKGYTGDNWEKTEAAKAVFVEYGHIVTHPKTGAVIGYEPAQPFIRPALRAGRRKLNAEFKKSMKKVLEQ